MVWSVKYRFVWRLEHPRSVVADDVAERLLEIAVHVADAGLFDSSQVDGST